MRVTVHTPRGLLVEVYETELLADATDEQVLADIRGRQPVTVRVEGEGERFVYARGLDALGEAGKRLEQTRAAASEALSNSRRLAVDAIASGASEYGVARALGVSRMTVREWLGKRER